MNRITRSSTAVGVAAVLALGIAAPAAYAAPPLPEPTKPYGDANTLCEGMDDTFTQNICTDIAVYEWLPADTSAASYTDTADSPYLTANGQLPSDADLSRPHQTVTLSGGGFDPTVNTIAAEGSQTDGTYFVQPNLLSLPLYGTVGTSLTDNTQRGNSVSIVDVTVSTAPLSSPTSYSAEVSIPAGLLPQFESTTHPTGDVVVSPLTGEFGEVTLPATPELQQGVDVTAATPSWVRVISFDNGDEYAIAGWDLTATAVIAVELDGFTHYATRDIFFSARTEWIGASSNSGSFDGQLGVVGAASVLSWRAQADETPFTVYAAGEQPPVVEPPVTEPPTVEPPAETPPAVEPPVVTPPVDEPPVEEAPPAASSIPQLDGREDGWLLPVGVSLMFAALTAAAVIFIRKVRAV